MRFTIITPSFNQLDYLKRCVASVQDQPPSLEASAVKRCEPITVHHHVQDGGSTDGSREFLAELEANSCELSANSYSFSYASEPDDGMYDAINKGIELALREQTSENGRRKTEEEIHLIAHLNCDEQYLPDALAKVIAYAERHPDVDVLFGDVLIVRPDGELVCCRKVVKPSVGFVQLHHTPTFTGATFFRSRIFEKSPMFFDTRWRAAGDAEWLLRLLRNKFKIGLLPSYTTAFTETGSNFSLFQTAVDERQALVNEAPALLRFFSWWFLVWHRIQKLLAGAYSGDKVAYALYTESIQKRTNFVVRNPCMRWATRSQRLDACES